MPVGVASAHEASALDAEAIAAGIPSRALMRVAATHAAAVIAKRVGAGQGVTIYTGPGNNGGDGWCVAQALARSGIRVTVRDVISAKTDDAIAERTLATHSITVSSLNDASVPVDAVIVDALLGTGSSDAPRGAIAEAVAQINVHRANGAYVVALDLPTGLDATTGAHEGSVHADLTITFGTCKRGHLIARDVCGEIVVVDIGLPTDTDSAAALPVLIDREWVRAQLPAIPFDAHKGIRKKLAVVAGSAGMGGAAILAAEGALRSGIGLVKVVTHPDHINAIHTRLPSALTAEFPTDATAARAIAEWADAVLIGPGLGHDAHARQLIELVLDAWRGPVVIDADALNVFDGAQDRLAQYTRGRPVIITPHPTEFARLAGNNIDTATVLNQRFDIAASLAQTLDATVLLKGTPTVVTTPSNHRYVTASGTAVLGTGGSGDMLGGIIATLLAQSCEPHVAAACGAWVHGYAAQLCDAPDAGSSTSRLASSSVRGFTLDDVLSHLPTVWRAVSSVNEGEGPRYPILASLRNVS